jgi:LAS superfamily LD-carboxypeptidase LdcB
MTTAVAGVPQYAQDYHKKEQLRVEQAATQIKPVATPNNIQSVRGILVNKSIANEVEAMMAAAQKDGVVLTGTGYRSTAVQINLRRQNCGTSQSDIFTKPESACKPPTAIPGTSMHEKGLAIDFWYCTNRSTPVYIWLADHAAAYGFKNRADESWHWSTNGQ